VRKIVIFPDSLTVTAIDISTGNPLPEIALVLELKARRKNNYLVGPIITDDAGNAKFTRRGCEDSIANDQRMFVMDYSGDLSLCGQVAEIQLHPPDYITTMIHNFESHPEFWGSRFGSPEELFARLRNVKNSSFEPAKLKVTEFEIAENPAIRFPLRRKQGDRP
jgi:hypothetical protein